jgi:hypothetical protein
MRFASASVLGLFFLCCGGSEPASQPASPPPQSQAFGANGPCSWLTDAEISDLIGQPSKTAVDPETKNCNITPADANGTTKGFYTVRDNHGAYAFTKAMKTAEDLQGVGDMAVWDDGFIGGAKGARGFSVRLESATAKKVDASNYKPQAIALAKKIAERL